MTNFLAEVLYKTSIADIFDEESNLSSLFHLPTDQDITSIYLSHHTILAGNSVNNHDEPRYAGVVV